jgi:hypothetical protein
MPSQPRRAPGDRRHRQERVANAQPGGAGCQEMPLEDFRRVLDVNVMGYVYGARAALSYSYRMSWS